MSKITLVIVAGGSGRRMGAGINKVFLKIGRKSIIFCTLNTFSHCKQIDEIIVVTRKEDIFKMKAECSIFPKVKKVVCGGETRQESVYNGLLAVKNSEYVIISDAARALVTEEIIENCIDDMKKYKASACGVPCKDTLKLADENGFIEKTLDRSRIYNIQTPQCFLYDEIFDAHKRARKDKFKATDDCMLYEKYIGKVKITQSSYENIKITTADDLVISENILKKREDEK